jgi:hypothetical protein
LILLLEPLLDGGARRLMIKEVENANAGVHDTDGMQQEYPGCKA